MKLALLVLSVLFFIVVNSTPENKYRSTFTTWMHQHGKAYKSDDFPSRYAIFKNNYDFVEAHNAGGHSYEVGLNHLADLTDAEFRAGLLGLAPRLKAEGLPAVIETLPLINVRSEQQEASTAVEPAEGSSRSKRTLPTTVDWQGAGAVTPVKNQGTCGCCWAFASTAAVESYNMIFNGLSAPIVLSDQNTLDCTTSGDCNGGYAYDGIKQVITSGGVDTNASYPYTGSKGSTCKYTAANKGASVNSAVGLLPNSESALQAQVVIQPVVISIDASLQSFRLYKTGIYSDTACSSTTTDHNVLLTGYGVTNTQPWWRFKNQWGTSWGQAGYMQIQRGVNRCALASGSFYPSMALPTPTFSVYNDSFVNSWTYVTTKCTSVNPSTTPGYAGSYAFSAVVAVNGTVSLQLGQGSLAYTSVKAALKASVSGAKWQLIITTATSTWTWSSVTTNNYWQQFTFTVGAGSSISQIQFVKIGTAAATLFLDNVQLV